MKIRSVKMNNHKKVFVLRTYKDRYEYPYALLDTRPTDDDRIVKAYVDSELGAEAFTYELASGAEDSVHIDRVLEYSQDPSYLRDLLLYKLTLEAKKLVDASPLGIRELSRRLGTSPTQLYRVLDEENNRKSLDRVFDLLTVLQCRIDIRSKGNRAKRARATHPGQATLELIVRT
jgi:hypothetical protein